jgi:uncharacterized membrane protein required for colicin V production
MWYDLLVIGILIFFALRGAAKGVVWQLAGIAGIVLCLMFSQGISAAFGPYVTLDPPLNHWVVMFGAYLVFSFIAFGFARVMNDWIEKASLEYFNRHLGAIFGLLKGVVLCVIMTYFLVTLSPKAREALMESKTGYASAVIMDTLHPLLPEKLHDKVAEYIRNFDLPRSSLAGTGQTTDPNQPGGGLPWPDFGQPSSSGSAFDAFLAQLPRTVGDDLKAAIVRSLENTPPQQRAIAQQQLLDTLSRTPPQDLPALKQQLLAQGRQSLIDALTSWTRPATPVQPQPQFPIQPGPASGASAARDQMLADISRRFSSIPPVQLQVQEDIRRRLAGLPEDVSLAVLTDWHHDLTAGTAADPEPQTNANSPLETRILWQLQKRGIPVKQLSSEVQDRLDGATLR